MQAGRCLRQHSVRCTYAVVCLASSWACKELRTEVLHAMLVCTPASHSAKNANQCHTLSIQQHPKFPAARPTKRAAKCSHIWGAATPPHLPHLLIRSIRNEGQPGCAASQARALQTAHRTLSIQGWLGWDIGFRGFSGSLQIMQHNVLPC